MFWKLHMLIEIIGRGGVRTNLSVRNCSFCLSNLTAPGVIERADNSETPLSLNKKKRWEEVDNWRENGDVLEITHAHRNNWKLYLARRRNVSKYVVDEETLQKRKKEGKRVLPFPTRIVRYPVHLSYRHNASILRKPCFIHQHNFKEASKIKSKGKGKGRNKGEGSWKGRPTFPKTSKLDDYLSSTF